MKNSISWKSILENILISIYIFREAIHQKALLEFLKDHVFFTRVVIPVTLVLSNVNTQHNPFQNTEYRFVELHFGDLLDSEYCFPIQSRYYKARRNLSNGMRGFVLVNGITVVGDIWCITPQNHDVPIKHPELDMMGISCINGDVYAVDIFIDPAYRSKKLGVPVHQSLELTLKNEGWLRVYGWVYEDNISSKWLHFMLKFKELPKLRAFRFFFIRGTYRYSPCINSR